MRQKLLDDAEEEIDAMKSIRDICDDNGLDGAECFVYGEQFLDYETNKVRTIDVVRTQRSCFAVMYVFMH